MTLFLDTEATDKYPRTAEVLSVAIINQAGEVLLDTLVRPVRHTSWPEAQRIHGIRPADVLHEAVPTLCQLNRRIADLLRGQEVVIYNAEYDSTILAEAFALGPPAQIHCAMLRYSQHPEVREWNDRYGDWRYQSLATATYHVGHEWQGKAHTALADCYAARDVWNWCIDPLARQQLEAAKQARADDAHVAWYVEFKARCARELAEYEQRERNLAWEHVYYPGLGLNPGRNRTSARESAAVFCQQLTGYSLQVWNSFAEKLFLPRYTSRVGTNPLPPHLVERGGHYHFLRTTWQPWEDWVFSSPPEDFIEPAGLYCYDHNREGALRPVFDLSRLELGVDYVPVRGKGDYDPRYCSATALERDYRLTDAAIAAQRPVALQEGKIDYLVYLRPDAQPQPTP